MPVEARPQRGTVFRILSETAFWVNDGAAASEKRQTCRGRRDRVSWRRRERQRCYLAAAEETSAEL